MIAVLGEGTDLDPRQLLQAGQFFATISSLYFVGWGIIVSWRPVVTLELGLRCGTFVNAIPAPPRSHWVIADSVLHDQDHLGLRPTRISPGVDCAEPQDALEWIIHP